MLVRIVGLVTLLVMGAACSYNKMEYGQAGVFKNETTDESLKVQVIWVKNKKEASDIKLRFVNDYKFPLAIKYSDIFWELNGEKSSLTSPIDGTMTLLSGHFADRTMIFRFMGPSMRAGAGKLSIVKILEVDAEGEPTKKKLAPMSLEVPVNAY